MIYIEPEILKRINTWLTPAFDQETQKYIKESIAFRPKEIQESFYKDLEFGTGGMRGIMGIGTNRINKYTLGKNTQGLSNYLHKKFQNQQLKVAIAYDCRHNSKSLAKLVADVFSANTIQVYLFENLRPTPELSFTLKYLNCHCGIVLTASHNPPEYNGYKVYWQDGGQLVPPQDEEIIKEISTVDYSEIKFESNNKYIQYIGKEMDEVFINASLKNGSFITNAERKNLKIVFTSLHGTAITLIPEVLKRAGYNQLSIVEEQAVPNGDFPTVKSPNPEEPEALEMALQLAKKVEADIVIGTDPDGDRLGIAVRNHKNELTLLNGNQTMVLLTHYLLKKWKEKDLLKGKEFVGCTIVSTPMMRKLTTSFGVNYKEGLTGFKWIAKMIKDFPELNFIGGGEESFGFMVGDFVRDKDAVTSTLLACEIAAEAKTNGSSLYKELIALYLKHGFYKEHLISITKKGIEGVEEIKQIMIDARKNPRKEINGSKVIRMEDYLTSTATHLEEGTTTPINVPQSNVLIYYTEDGSKIALRPSGTEPKIKYYISVNSTLNSISEFEAVEAKLDQKIKAISTNMNLS